MIISKVYIENFKCFDGGFTIQFNKNLNILVGRNEAGKSTILDAIHLALSGIIHGNYLRNELSQYLFNINVVNRYLKNVKESIDFTPPSILIEVFFLGEKCSSFEGDGNFEKTKNAGVSLKIEFDEDYTSYYEQLLTKDIESIPIELYKITWKSFSRDNVNLRVIPIKSVLIDSSSYKFSNGSDIYVSRIIKNNLSDNQKADISQSFRRLKENFMLDNAIKAINGMITNDSKIATSKNVEISVDLSQRNAWENTLITYLDKIPFYQIGKGEQCIIKTNLSLSHKKNDEANLILLEEPENHLSHTKLNEFIKNVVDYSNGKQIIISTHSSFVANKLGLNNLILLNVDMLTNKRENFVLSNLNKSTYQYFKKLSGYEVLRLILCKKAILVEGDSDELIIQKAYMDFNNGSLPIENMIDVISVRSLAFKRFLDIAKELKQPTAVVTDNDGDYSHKINDKYSDYSNTSSIGIFADERNELKTLEPQFVDANKDNLENLCKAIDINLEYHDTIDKIVKYMTGNKTKWAMDLFDSKIEINYPNYIKRVIEWCNE